jgi:hypothetical protein
MVNVANIEDGTVIKSETLRLLDHATQKYDVFAKKYLKLQIQGDGKTISLTEVVVTGATRVAVTASSVNSGRDPNLLINGIIKGLWNDNDVTLTLKEGSKNPWIKIELEGVADFNQVKATIYGRTDCCQDKMNGMIATLEYGIIV